MSILLENIYTCHFDLSILIIEFNLLNAENLEKKKMKKKKSYFPYSGISDTNDYQKVPPASADIRICSSREFSMGFRCNFYAYEFNLVKAQRE